MLQAPLFDGLAFDVGPLAQDVGGSAEVGVCRRHVAQALVVSGMVVVLDEGADLGLQVAGQEVVFQQDPVLQGLMPALDLLKAWNTGHPGGLATLHANSAAEGLTRLEDLIGEVTQRIPYRAITQAINLVIHIARAPAGRRVQEVCRVTGREGDAYVLEACVEGQAVGRG